jgi:hypothetical protein
MSNDEWSGAGRAVCCLVLRAVLIHFAAMKFSRCLAQVLGLALVAFGPWCSVTHAAAPDSPEYRKYAPDREVDILHLTLDVTPDFTKRTVSGAATWKFKPIAKPFAELKLDAVDLTVASVTSTEKILGYQVTDEKVIVTFADAIPVGKEASVTVQYNAQPEKGLYFRTPELGYKPEDMHIWTQGEPHGRAIGIRATIIQTRSSPWR